MSSVPPELPYDLTEEQRVGPLRTPLDASEAIAETGLTLGRFWSWAYSDVLSNGCVVAWGSSWSDLPSG